MGSQEGPTGRGCDGVGRERRGGPGAFERSVGPTKEDPQPGSRAFPSLRHTTADESGLDTAEEAGSMGTPPCLLSRPFPLRPLPCIRSAVQGPRDVQNPSLWLSPSGLRLPQRRRDTEASRGEDRERSGGVTTRWLTWRSGWS